MSDYRDWYKSHTGTRITADDIGKILNMSRPSVTRRLTQDGLSADEIITVTRALGSNPVEALVDLGHITHEEASNFLDLDGQLVETALDGDLALELARRLNPATKAPILDELAARRANTPMSTHHAYNDGTVTEFDWNQAHAADSSPNEQEEREKRGEEIID